MDHPNNHYIYFYLFLIFYSFFGVESFIPVGRTAHSSILAGNKLYFFGGQNDVVQSLNDLFYLDVSQPFNMTFIPWTDLTTTAGIPFRSSWASVAINEVKNPIIYLIGGITKYQNEGGLNTSLLHTFDPESLQWNIPIIKGKEPEKRRNMMAVTDDSGMIYLFGGDTSKLTGAEAFKAFNDMIILNTNDLTWSYGPLLNAPTRRYLYSATLLPNGIIVYIGGREVTDDGISREVDINQINLYNTKLATWSTMQVKSNNQIESRRSHTAVLASDGRIIIYGGSKSTVYFKVTPDLAVLNTQINPFEWILPQVFSNVGNVPSLTTHTANLVGNHMIVAFGNITRENAYPLEVKNSKIYLLDVRNYTWVDTFEPTNTSPTTTSPSTTSTTLPAKKSTVNRVIIIIGSLSGILSFVVLVGIGFFGYKRYKKQQSNQTIMRIPGGRN